MECCFLHFSCLWHHTKSSALFVCHLCHFTKSQKFAFSASKQSVYGSSVDLRMGLDFNRLEQLLFPAVASDRLADNINSSRCLFADKCIFCTLLIFWMVAINKTVFLYPAEIAQKQIKIVSYVACYMHVDPQSMMYNFRLPSLRFLYAEQLTRNKCPKGESKGDGARLR